ncbi:MAG TPA: PPOX class F420-dependent oxidoreductase [Polyangiaceae bacterium]|nr:PPOX class F420-dependent oxidoreductase [Polyangiaceae bacterium]
MDIREFDQHRYMNLATFRKTGAEVKTPVWFAETGGKLYCFSAADAGKLKRLRNSPKARVAPCDVRGKVLGAWRDTSARIVDDQALIRRVYDAFGQKYGWQIALFNLGARLVGRYNKRVFVEVDY